MSMRLVSYQPQYFPRLHYFARILASDIFAVADYVQFVRKHAYHMPDGSKPIGPSYQAHTQIKTAGGTMLLDVPTRSGGLPAINETRLAFNTPKDRLRNSRLIATHYRTAPRFKEVMPHMEDFFQRPHETLGALNIESMYFALALMMELPGTASPDDVMQALEKSPFRLRRTVLFSESGVASSDKESGRDANDWLVDACRSFGADEYYFGGSGADAYMDFSRFQEAGIKLVQQEWSCAPYPQQHGDFTPNLSVIDLLMNVEPARAREIVFTSNQ